MTNMKTITINSWQKNYKILQNITKHYKLFYNVYNPFILYKITKLAWWCSNCLPMITEIKNTAIKRDTTHILLSDEQHQLDLLLLVIELDDPK